MIWLSWRWRRDTGGDRMGEGGGGEDRGGPGDHPVVVMQYNTMDHINHYFGSGHGPGHGPLLTCWDQLNLKTIIIISHAARTNTN